MYFPADYVTFSLYHITTCCISYTCDSHSIKQNIINSPIGPEIQKKLLIHLTCLKVTVYHHFIKKDTHSSILGGLIPDNNVQGVIICFKSTSL